MHEYDRGELKRLFGLSATTVRFLVRSGLLHPTPHGHSAAYSFRDLVTLRTIGALQATHLPTRTLHRALRNLKPWLSDELPMSRISLQSMTAGVMVRDGASIWEPASGQYALPLEVTDQRSHIVPMKKRTPPKKPIGNAHDHYLRGADLERDDAAAARAAYEACLDGDCSHLNARINLGRLLHLEGRHGEAESIYRDTQEKDATLLFNLGVLLEDQGRSSEAMTAYREAIVHDPGLADAHFNLALMLERSGDAQAAFRHLLAYRRLSNIRESKTR